MLQPKENEPRERNRKGKTIVDIKIDRICVVVNYKCQLDWILGRPDMWLNMVAGYVFEGVSG